MDNIVTPTTNFFLQAMKGYEEVKAKKPRNYPQILVVGSSGTGKTRAIKSLPPQETAIINVENKPLSFSGGENFPYQFADFKLPQDVEDTIRKCFAEPSIKYVVIDSLTKYLERLLQLAAETKKGYDIWSYYNTQVGVFLELIKNCGSKMVILTGIDELVQIMQPNGTNVSSRRVSIAGKQWEGKVEKEFTLVLFTDVKRIGDKSEYTFLTNSDGTNSAKTPEDMFKQPRIPNDLKLVCDRVREFYNLG